MSQDRCFAPASWVDEDSDLALLKVDAITPFVYLSHSNGVPAGMDVITMGYPQVMCSYHHKGHPWHRQQRARYARRPKLFPI